MSEAITLQGVPLSPIYLGPQIEAFNTPLEKTAASGATNLETKQRGAVVGEPIPIVFCRRVNNVGGVLISPPATESRFEDDGTTGDITASYHLILSEGEIEPIQVRDVFQRSCRVGTFTQTYNRRAGTFVPGNFVDNTPDLEISSYCGTGGTYAGLSTMAFSVTIPAGFDQWNRQIHCFVRGGIYVSRLLDSITGPSNNVADLLLYLFRVSSNVPDDMIDMASLTTAATFTNANSFFFNGVIAESTNLRDWMANILPYFLLRQTRISGKEGLQPLLPTNANGTIKTTAVTWSFTFTETHIVPGSVEIVYTSLTERKAFCAQILWRQQDDFGIPLIRTAEVRYQNFATDGPYEQFDLSDFCSSENHAVKVGAYMLSKRRHVSHRLTISVRPDGYNTTLAAGALVRVRLQIVPSEGLPSVHDYLYEVDRITKSLTGEVNLELTHFPVNSNLESLVAIDVAAAVGAGDTLDSGLSAITCDINSDDDTDVPTEVFDDTPPTLPDEDVVIPDPVATNSDFDSGDYGDYEDEGLEGVPDDEASNPDEIIPTAQLGSNGDDPNSPSVGDQLTLNGQCEGGQVTYWRTDPTAPGGRVAVARNPENASYTLQINDVNQSVYAEWDCPDPSSPTGRSDLSRTSSVGPVVNRYYTETNKLLLFEAASGTLNVTTTTGPSTTVRCSTGVSQTTNTNTNNYSISVTNVTEIWTGTNAGGFSIGCGGAGPDVVWDGSLYYRTTSGNVTKVSFYGGTYRSSGGWGVTSSISTSGSITFSFVTVQNGQTSSVYVGYNLPKQS